MNPGDYRNATWEQLQKGLTGMRSRAYFAWLRFGPGTTEQVALASGISLLTFRPRTTELFQMGLVELEVRSQKSEVRSQVAEGRGGHEGHYRAVTRQEWEPRAEARRSGRAEQMALL